MTIAILDCYTDEPAGLGVPPYLGTYPRYIAGAMQGQDKEIYYLTIDDLRLWRYYKGKKKDRKEELKTNIKVYNLTKNRGKVKEILDNTSELIVIAGVHVPGKYLSALPGTLAEVSGLIGELKCKKVLTGPALFGTQLYGGRVAEKADADISEHHRKHTKGHVFDMSEIAKDTISEHTQKHVKGRVFDIIEPFNFSYDAVKEYAVNGSFILDQIPDLRIIEIETGKGCNVGKCSFCTEPLKSSVVYRPMEDIVAEVKAFYDKGQRYFRFGKQACFYSYPDAIELLRRTREECPAIEVLHIDNVNPIFVPTPRGEEITKAIVKYCTPGNIAAFGAESFDPIVIKENTLNCSAEMAMKAVRSINKHGAERGYNGMPKFLPGINLIFGLKEESKATHEWNMKYLRQILDENLLIRRINIRQVALFEGTALFKTVKNKFLKKNKRMYWKWRNEIRQKIDFEMLKRLVPEGAVLKDCWAEAYDGNTTFCRQIGTYPLITGVKGRLPLFRFYNIRVTDHMLRSVVGEIAR